MFHAGGFVYIIQFMSGVYCSCLFSQMMCEVYDNAFHLPIPDIGLKIFRG